MKKLYTSERSGAFPTQAHEEEECMTDSSVTSVTETIGLSQTMTLSPWTRIYPLNSPHSFIFPLIRHRNQLEVLERCSCNYLIEYFSANTWNCAGDSPRFQEMLAIANPPTPLALLLWRQCLLFPDRKDPWLHVDP
uniref:Uncharacterized protein n=2 Tax=Physcomitrium patens TaxID=3218 RepID=A0A2K1KKW0_PHYPA|nr:hypothetical protein PHYPA_008091 [Physcomitrium patens]